MKFALRDTKGPKATVIAAIQAAPDVPAEAKAFLVALVNGRPCDGVVLDVHVSADGANVAGHFHVRKLY